MDVEELIEKLSDVGPHRDVEVSETNLEEVLEDLSVTEVSFYDSPPSYRDGNSFFTVHLTDHRGSGSPRETIVCHLEWFNPEDHPLLHALFDFIPWLFHNRVRGKGTWTIEGIS